MYNAIRRFGVPALLLMFIGAVVGQQPGDLLKQAEEKKRIEAQRLEAVYSDAMRDANALGRTQPRRAVEILQDAVGQLTRDTEALKSERREELLRKLRLEISTWSQRADIRPVTPGTGTTTQPRPDTRTAQDSKDLSDYA